MAVIEIAPPAKLFKLAKKAINGSGEALNKLRNLFKPSSCFVAGTIVQTKDGPKAIEKIEVGDLVASKNDQTGETDFKPVVQLFNFKDKVVINLTFETRQGDEELIQATPEHPFMLKNGQWMSAGQLTPGDMIKTFDNKVVRLKSVATDAQRQEVYNFEVADFHTYFVGETGVWVHNTDCGVDGSWRLIGANKAKIDPRKLNDYALNPEHPVGKNKAIVFESALGFNKSNAQQLINQIKKGVANHTPIKGHADKYGERFSVDILLMAQRGMLLLELHGY